ncbi:MAG: hypothetical protein AAB932_01090, partial [Patescibacteria group bacterium]
ICEDENGGCRTYGYGYCTKEKNLWSMPGDVCPAYYATCRTFFDAGNRAVSYVARTIDFGECTADSAGCLAYSLEQVNGAWKSSAAVTETSPNFYDLKRLGRSQMLFANAQIRGGCSEPGCTALYTAQRAGLGESLQEGGFRTLDGNFIKNKTDAGLLHLKKAPDYLGCYDTNRVPNSPEINWPQTQIELLNNLPKGVAGDACENFARACIREEVGCEAYTPALGGPTVPGVVGRNQCDSDCNGYDAFKQEATAFDPQEFPLYFIPSSAGDCKREEVGCSEFTNLESAGAGGERLEWYTDITYCEKPNGANENVFYSWEGSIEEGFVLKTHRLLPVREEREKAYLNRLTLSFNANQIFSANSPAYPLEDSGYYNDAYAACNEAVYA